MRSSVLSFAGSVALVVAAFLPWLRLGNVGLSGVPDPAGFFVLALGAVGVILSAIRLLTRRDTRQWLVLVGLAGLTTLGVVWWTGPAVIADRARARAEAISIVDGVPLETVPAVRAGFGLFVGLAAATLLVGVGLDSARTPADG
jgi:hypothetical protein